MNSTQAEIFKRLQKVQSNRLTKKQELGAIEDAINETKSNIEAKAEVYTDFMKQLDVFYASLSSQLDSLYSQCESLLGDGQSLQSYLDDLNQEIEEAKSYGVSFSTTEYPNIANSVFFEDYYLGLSEVSDYLSEVMSKTYQG